MSNQTPETPTTGQQMAILETDPREIVSDLAATMPKPTAPTSAPAAPATPTPTPATGNVAHGEAPRDALGRAFDPVKFAANPDGSPKLDKAGRFYSARLGRPGKATAAPTQGSFIPTDEPAAPAPAAPNASPAAVGKAPASVVEIAENATAETCIGLLQTVLVWIGEEEGVLSDTEKTLLRTPLLRVLDKYKIGSDVLPPELELALAVVAIVIERIKRGRKFATWFAKVKAGIVEMLFRRRGAVMGAQIRREVRPDLVASLSEELRRAQAELAALRRAQPADPSAN